MLAIFLGIVISTPIEMKIFDDVIKENLPTIKAKANEKFNVQKAEFELEKKTLIARKDSLSRELFTQQSGAIETIRSLERAKSELNELNDKLYKEIYGTGATKMAGKGPAARELEEQRDAKQREVNQLTAKADRESLEQEEAIKENRVRLQHDINQLESELQYVQGQINEINASKKDTTEGLENFSAQLEAMYIGTSWEESHTLFFARIMVMLLFVAIEVIPTFFKMMMEDGPYDNLLRSEKHRVRVLADKRISDVNDEVNTAVKISTMKNHKRLEAEAIANEEVLKRIANVQSELLQKSIEAWREEELRKIAENPMAYIKIDAENKRES